MAKRRHSIEQDTAILPHVVADGVVQEVVLALNDERHALDAKVGAFVDGDAPQRTLSDALARRAEQTYRSNESFAKDMHSHAGRDKLYMWMRHWAAAEVRRDLGSPAFEALPEGFAVGKEPVRAPAPGM